MKKADKKVKSPVYFRYEFSDEAGRPEGGDIFQFSSTDKIQSMMEDVLQVAQSDGVTVAFTVGDEKSFFNFLKNTGISRKEAEKELVDLSAIPAYSEKPVKKAKAAQGKTVKKKTSKKKAKK